MYWTELRKSKIISAPLLKGEKGIQWRGVWHWSWWSPPPPPPPFPPSAPPPCIQNPSHKLYPKRTILINVLYDFSLWSGCPILMDVFLWYGMKVSQNLRSFINHTKKKFLLIHSYSQFVSKLCKYFDFLLWIWIFHFGYNLCDGLRTFNWEHTKLVLYYLRLDASCNFCKNVNLT